MESLNWTDPKIEAEAERKYLEIALLLSDVAKEMLFNKFVTDEPFKVFAHEAGRLYELAGFAGQQALKIKYRTLVINHEHGTEDAGR